MANESHDYPGPEKGKEPPPDNELVVRRERWVACRLGEARSIGPWHAQTGPADENSGDE